VLVVIISIKFKQMNFTQFVIEQPWIIERI